MSSFNLPGFEVVEKLGEGGMASVWKARQISLDRVVAIKILSSRLASDPTDIQMFQKEAQSAAKLKHPGIVQVYDASVDQGLYYFVMEYVAGYTVGDWIRRKNVLSETNALLVAECVADALAYAWAHERIIHCDIKPDNVIIDSDGAVKIADLGLAKTISAMNVDEVDEDVMGTPAYMSPEQAMGAGDIDFRSDIYSLGAMLYHLVTGKVLFEGYPDDSIMDKQVNDFVNDPMDLNPAISKPMAWMIEKMLSKDKSNRQSSWEDVISDIALVKAGAMPKSGMPVQNASTVRRSASRTPLDFRDDSVSSKQHKFRLLPILAVCGVLLFVAVLSVRLLNNKSSKSKIHSQNIQQQPAVSAVADKLDNAKEMYAFALNFKNKNPDKYDDIISSFRKVAGQTRGTKYALMAEKEVRDAFNSKLRKIESVFEKLDNDTSYFIKNGEFVHAAHIYQEYNGPFTEETREKRSAIAEDILAKKQDRDQQEQKSLLALKDWGDQILDELALTLVDNGLLAGKQYLQDQLKNSQFAKLEEAQDADEIHSAVKLIDDAIAVDKKIIQTFNRQIGQTIPVYLVKGLKRIKISKVTDSIVFGQLQMSANVIVEYRFGIQDLSAREILARMGTHDTYEIALKKGLLALAFKNMESARKYLAMTHPVLADRLVASIDDARHKAIEGNARRALDSIIKSMGVVVGPFNPESWINAINEKDVSEQSASQTDKLVDEFRKQYGGTDFGKSVEPILNAIKQKIKQPSADRSLIKSNVNSGLNSHLDRGIEELIGNTPAVIAKLISDNHGLSVEDIAIDSDENGAVLSLSVFSPFLRDASALAAFRGLKKLTIGAYDPKEYWVREGVDRAKINDLRFLKGMHLEALTIAKTYIKDLSYLQGMDIVALQIIDCPFSDLDQIKSLPIKVLNVPYTMVRDISALKDMNLVSLDLSYTRGYQFHALANLPLEHLNLSGNQIKNLDFVRDMPLKYLDLNDVTLVNYNDLGGIKLQHLSLAGSNIKDIELLKDMPLTWLSLQNTAIRSLDCLKNKPLTYLDISNTRIFDLTPVLSMNLRRINIQNTAIRSLDCLKNKPLIDLNISNTKISDLTPILSMNLRSLNIQGTHILDLSPLARTKIAYLLIDDPSSSKVQRVLQSMPMLKTVNYEPFLR